MRRLLIFLVFVVIVLVAADRIAWFVAERGLASEIQSSQKLTETPDVSIKGFPFLTQAIGGDYKSIHATVHNLTVQDGVTVSALDVTLNQVHVPLSQLVHNSVTSAPVEHASATALIGYSTIDAAAKANIRDDNFTVKFGPGTNGNVKVTGSYKSSLISGSLNGQAKVRVENGDLAVALDPDSLKDVPQIIRTQLASLIGVSYKLPDLPFGFQARGVTVGPEGVQVNAAASNVELSATP